MKRPVVSVVAAALINSQKKVLLARRPEGKDMAGLWEFPGGMIRMSEGGNDCVVREAMETLNVLVNPGACVKRINHSYSHFTITMEAYRCSFINGRAKAIGCADYRWIYPYETNRFAFHRANHKLFDKIEGAVSI